MRPNLTLYGRDTVWSC